MTESKVLFLRTVLVSFLGILLLCSYLILRPFMLKTDSNTTFLEVRNQHPTDTILTYLTLNGGDGFVSDVNGIFGITSTKDLQGSFYLLPNESKRYKSPEGLAISGNISFGRPPQNCPYAGTTLYEFNLNNKLTGVNAQETIDISCVAGVTTIGEIIAGGGTSKWTDNHGKNITTIKNKCLYNNTGISGVFPYGCTNCVNTEGAADCKPRAAYATPNTLNICNVQRNAKKNGGTVVICYKKNLNP